MTAVQKTISKQTVQMLIMVVCMFGIGLLPPVGQLTEMGMRLLGVFVGVIYGWIVMGLLWPSLIGIIAFGFTGYFESMEACFSASFGTQTAVLILGCTFMCVFVEESGISNVMVSWLLNLKIAKKNPYSMAFFFLFACWWVGAVTTSIVSAMLFLNLYRDMSAKAGAKPYTKEQSFWMIGIALSSVCGDVALPFKPGAIIFMNLYTAYTGANFGAVQYLLYVGLGLLIMLPIYVLVGRFLMRADLSIFKTMDFDKVVPTKRQKISLAFMAVLLVGLMLPDLAKNSSLWIFKTIGYLGTGGVILSLIVIMMALRINGEPLLDLQKLSGKFQWGVYFCVSFYMSFASALVSGDAEITATLQELCGTILGHVPTMVFVFAAIVAAIVVTNVLNNTITVIIFMSLFFSVADSLAGVNLFAVTIALILSSFVACATPAANPVCAYLFAQTDIINQKQLLLYGCLTCGILALMIAFVYYPILNVIL